MALRLKSISKINAKSAINENITIDAKHNDMVKYFKDLQKSIPVLKNDLKNLINKYKTLDTKDKSEFEVIMEKNDLRDKINELKEKINCIVEKEEENKYFLEVGVLLHNYYETMENSKNDDAENDLEAAKGGKVAITGNLTIKGITKPVSFMATVNSKNGFQATATLVFDRTKYDIKYASGIIGTVADKAIEDNVTLNITIK